MIWHASTDLDGPVTKGRGWWTPPVLGEEAGTAISVADGDIRVDLVRRVRAEIVAGTYDTPEKLEIALGRLLERLGEE